LSQLLFYNFKIKMSLYKLTITRLLKKISSQNEGCYLSGYYPAGQMTKKQLARRSSVYLFNKLKKDNFFQKRSLISQTASEEVKKNIQKLDDIGKGIAFFAILSKDFKKQKTNELFDFFDIVPLHLSPKKEITVGKVFDLDQLVWVDNHKIEAVVCYIDSEKADFFLLNRKKFTKINSLKNKFFDERQPEYLEKHSPTLKDKTFYGTGADKSDKNQDKSNQLFFQKIKRNILKNKTITSESQYCVIIYSKSFSFLINNSFKQQLENKFHKIKMIFFQKTFIRNSEIKQKAIELIKKTQKKQKIKIYRKIQNKKSLQVKGWTKVTKFARQNRIEVLFTPPKAEKQGYLLDNQFVYTYPVKNSRKVKNIAPWLVRSVLEGNGRVFIKTGEVVDKKPEIIAKLRF